VVVIVVVGQESSLGLLLAVRTGCLVGKRQTRLDLGEGFFRRLAIGLQLEHPFFLLSKLLFELALELGLLHGVLDESVGRTILASGTLGGIIKPFRSWM
jgi:hypothetical protein